MQKTSLREKMENLVLIGDFIEDLYIYAVEPTEEKIAEFHNKYSNRNKIAGIKEAIRFKTWGDEQILHDGIAILENIGNGAQLSEVADNMKRAAIDSFRRDLADTFTISRNCLERPECSVPIITRDRITDFFNDYNCKLEHIKKLTDDAALIESVTKVIEILDGHLEHCHKMQYGGELPESAYRSLRVGVRDNRGIPCMRLPFVDEGIICGSKHGRRTTDLKPHIYQIQSYLGLEVPQEEIAAEASSSQGYTFFQRFLQLLSDIIAWFKEKLVLARFINTEVPQEQQGVSSQEREANSFASMEGERRKNSRCRIM